MQFTYQITNHQRGDNRRHVTEDVKHATAQAHNLFWRGIRNHRPAQRTKTFSEERQCHQRNHQNSIVGVVAQNNGRSQQHSEHNRQLTRQSNRLTAFNQMIREHATQHTARKSTQRRDRGDQADFQNRHALFLDQINREPGEEEPGDGVDKVLTKKHAEHHTVGQ
ncbi:hypothetical protein D1872_276600 [compost metagenome]